MSIRTAIEINHDYHHARQAPEFLAALTWALYHGTAEDWDNLRRVYGVERVYRCHHRDDRLEAHKAQRHPANFKRTP
jgi:hypothetical protein